MILSYATLSGAELAAACADTDDLAAWQEFVRRFQPLVSRVAANAVHRWGDRSVQLVDDIVQETYLRLCADRCRVLRNFRERHPDSIFGFIKAVAASVANDHMRTLYATKRGGDLDEISFADCLEVTPASSTGADDMTRYVLLKEVDGALRASGAGERDRLVFWLYYRGGLTAKAISSLQTIGLSTKGVESLILRLTRSVRAKLNWDPRRPEVNKKPGSEGICTA